MADTIKIQLSDIYEPITPEDVRTAKNYVLRREQACRGLSSLIDAFLKDAADKITRICYRHGVDPRTFTISSVYNDKMFDEVAAVLDQLEEDILDLVTDYATRCTESERRKASLLPWIALLGRNNKGLRRTLEDRLWVFSRDLEAMIAATRLAKLDVTTAANRIMSNLHTVYVMPEVMAAIKNRSLMQATYIRSGGVKHGNVGNSNSEANNIIRFGKITVQMAWMRNLRERYKEEGAAGYYVGRGSNYPCAICQEKVGFHPIDDTDSFPPQHGSCVCWAVPVNKKEEQIHQEKKEKKEVITPDFKERRKEIKEEAIKRFKDVEFANKDVSWKAIMSNAGIKEWLNQPHKHIAEKNEALLNMKKLFRNAEYIKPIKDDKNRPGIERSHIFKTKIAGEDSWIIVHEMKWPEYQIYSIADNNPIKNK